MASFNSISQRTGSQHSQSIHLQPTQDALAEIASSVRPTSDANISAGNDTNLSKLEDSRSHDTSTGVRALSEENLQHRLNASGSVQAIVVDDDVLFAGLQGGDIVVSSLLTLSFVNLTSVTGLVA